MTQESRSSSTCYCINKCPKSYMGCKCPGHWDEKPLLFVYSRNSAEKEWVLSYRWRLSRLFTGGNTGRKMEGEEEKENNTRKRGLAKKIKKRKRKSYGNQERGLWEKICLSIPPELYDTSSPIIWPDWRWSPSYIFTLRKSLPVSPHSPCPTQSHSVSTENHPHTSSLRFLLDSAEPVPFPFVPHLYPAWEAHRKKETILCPLIFTHFPKPTETFHTMSINWFCSSPRLLVSEHKQFMV